MTDHNKNDHLLQHFAMNTHYALQYCCLFPLETWIYLNYFHMPDKDSSLVATCTYTTDTFKDSNCLIHMDKLIRSSSAFYRRLCHIIRGIYCRLFPHAAPRGQ